MKLKKITIGRWPIVAMASVIMLTLVVGSALAAHGLASLPGSNFEIDLDANLRVDHPPSSIDWAAGTVTEVRNTDQPTGKNDDSFAGGSKEDDACPRTTTGSIPNNKSDLLNFGVYVEEGSPGFLHLFWTRVQEPNGTTLMDFELNQSSDDCGNGVNRVRTIDDLLIEYRMVQGGAIAEIKVREWNGSAWGSEQDLTASGQATGTTNNTAIPSAEADGLGNLSARTFGEASLDLNFVFDENKCTSFGSAFLKSRSSDSFTSQLKDFIAPVPINLTNCGKVIVRKQTDPEEDPNTTAFGFTKSFATDPASDNTFSLTDDGVQTFDNVLFGTGLTVSEDTLPSGWELKEINCGASSDVTPSISGSTVTFDIDDESDVLDCTFTNEARGTIIIEKVTTDGAGSFVFNTDTLTPSPSSFTLTTTDKGNAGKASTTFADLRPGAYDVAETEPAGWNLQSASCNDGSPPNAIDLSAGETVTCTFTNVQKRGAILVTKTRKHAAAGIGLDSPHPGVKFTVNGVEGFTDVNGQVCFGGLLYDDYDVTETLPVGYIADGLLTKNVSVSVESTCWDGEEAKVNFKNTPLTDIAVSVDSQVDGGTFSTIECVNAGGASIGSAGSVEPDPLGTDDVTLDIDNLEPGVYVCTINIDP